MISVEELGAGPTVVLVHGIPGSGATWRTVADRSCLAPSGARSRPGGLRRAGGNPLIAELRADAQAEALASALDRLDVHAATVVGHDFGGPVALRLLDDRPDLVGGLGLLATNAFADTAIPFPLSAVAWPGIGPVVSRLLFSRPSLRLLTRRMVGTPPMRLDSRSYIGDDAQARAIRLIFTDALVNLAERYRPLEAILSRVTVPAAVIFGDRDPFFPLAHGTRTQRHSASTCGSLPAPVTPCPKSVPMKSPGRSRNWHGGFESPDELEPRRRGQLTPLAGSAPGGPSCARRHVSARGLASAPMPSSGFGASLWAYRLRSTSRRGGSLPSARRRSGTVPALLGQVILYGMTHRVGPKGQVVIPKALRDELGIEPGDEVSFWRHDDHVAVRPASHRRPLRGRFEGSSLVDALAAEREADRVRESER